MFGTLVSDVRNAVSRIEPGIAVPGLIAAALLAAPLGLAAQDDDGPAAGSVSVDARAGMVAPAADLDDVAQTGASFGGGVAVHLTPRVALRGDVAYQLFSGDTDSDGVEFADMKTLAATGGVEFLFLSPETRWTGSLSLGAGISTLETDDTLDDGSAAPVSADLTSLAVRSGLKLGYRAGERIDVYVQPGVYLVAFDRADTAPFAAASGDVEPFDVGWTIPLQAGVTFHLQ